MADVKESAMSQKNDCKWVRALDSNGNSILISKEDLASVVGGLLGIADKNKNGLLSKNIYASKFRSISVDNSKIVSFYVPRYTRGVINVLAVSTQNNIFYKEFKFIVDMNTGDIRYKIESQDAMIYMKLSDRSTVNYYYQYAEILADGQIVDAAVLDDFPSDAISL